MQNARRRSVLRTQIMLVAVLALLVLLAPPAAAGALAPPAPPSVAAGYSDSLIVKSDGSLWAWGANDRGQLGLGDRLPRELPTQVGTDTDWAQVAIGEMPFVVALKSDGTLWAWGDNQNGELGLGAWSEAVLSPTQVGSDADWAAVACGDEHTLALKQDGTLWAWGSNWYGQLGLDPNALDTEPLSPSFSPVHVGSATWQSVACGYAHSIAVRSDGTLWGWGANDYGQLGRGTADTATHVVPVQIGSAGTWAKAGCGFLASFGIRGDGSLYAWGWNNGGVLGDGSTVDRHAPVHVGSGTDWVTVAGANNYTAGVKSDGSLWTWGYNSYGEVGLLTIGAVVDPRRVGTRSDWVTVEPGAYHLLALSSGGEFGSCGAGFWGQTGIGYSQYRPLGEQVGTQAGWHGIDAGLGHSAGVRDDGTLWTWGRNSWGELGLGADVANANSPLQVGAATDWASVSCGDNTSSGFTEAIKTDGTLWAWGTNDVGQLGLGDDEARYTPVQVGTRTDWTAVSCSDGVGDIGRGLWGAGDLVDFTLALRADGTVWAWGDNSRGQLGQGDTAPETGRVAVQGLAGATIKTIATGDDYAVAISDGGTGVGRLYAWGGNANGQLGTGTQDTSVDHSGSVTTPAQVGTSADWLAVACGSGREGSHTAGIRDDDGDGRGTLWAWGDNTAGQLGLGDYTGRLTPTQVGGDQDWVAVSCGSSYGDDYTLARKADGSLWGFGGNFRGALGKGDYVASIVPEKITALSTPLNLPDPLVSFTSMACGSNSFAILGDGTLWAWGDNAYGQLGLGDPKANPLSGVYGLQDYVTADPDTTPPDVAATPDSTPVRSVRAARGDQRAVLVKWYRAPVTVRFAATDDKAGVSRVQYSLTNGVGWKTGASAKVTKNGITTVLYRGLDRVRNASDVSGKTVGVDTVRPKPSTPYPVVVKRYGTATIRYKVTDIKAMPSVKVTFVIRNAAGRTVKSWYRTGKSVNVALTESFRCTLARGGYRFSVYAQDLAGNKQLAPASNKLTVK